LLTDEAHCGQCGFPCELGDTCTAGLCIPDYEWANWPVPTFADSNYTTTNDTVTDRTTGLVWQRNVPSSYYKWANAKDYCAGLTLGGMVGWRLPTRIELLSIADVTCSSPAIDPNAFPGTPSEIFWSSSLQAGFADVAWVVSFGFGYSDYGATSNSSRVRCVR
jgi:hypothetical protein